MTTNVVATSNINVYKTTNTVTLSNINVLSYSSGDQKYEIKFTGLKSRC